MSTQVINIDMDVFLDALLRFYNRVGQSGSVTSHPKVVLAARMLKDSVVVHSRWYKRYQSQLSRPNYFVLFEAKSYNSTRFLALLSVFRRTDMNGHGIITVDYSDNLSANGVMVCDVKDIIKVVGLVKCSRDPSRLAVIWLDAKYHEKLTPRLRGEDLV